MDDDLDLEKLRSAILQEKQMKDVSDQSMDELVMTVEEYERRINDVEGEDSEWKSRFDIQKEQNEIMQRQILILHDKVDQAKRQLKEAQRNSFHHPLGDISTGLIKTLSKEKDALFAQRKDMDWRIDQENKAYHRANEERKVLYKEMVNLSESINELKTIPEFGAGVTASGTPPRTPKASLGGRKGRP